MLGVLRRPVLLLSLTAFAVPAIATACAASPSAGRPTSTHAQPPPGAPHAGSQCEHLIEYQQVTPDAFAAAKARLTLSQDFVDEQIEPEQPGGRGGYSAIWTATDGSGRHYLVEYMVDEGECTWMINEQRP